MLFFDGLHEIVDGGRTILSVILRVVLPIAYFEFEKMRSSSWVPIDSPVVCAASIETVISTLAMPASVPWPLDKVSQAAFLVITQSRRPSHVEPARSNPKFYHHRDLRARPGPGKRSPSAHHRQNRSATRRTRRRCAIHRRLRFARQRRGTRPKASSNYGRGERRPR